MRHSTVLRTAFVLVCATPVLCSPSHAAAGCHLSSPPVVMCQAPKNAALAYQAFGRDTNKMKVDYNRQMLHEAWCAVVSDTANSLTFETYSRGKIATPNGWVNVLQVGFKHDGLTDVRYVAAAYIRGECAHYQYDPAKSSGDVQAPQSPYLPSIPPGGYKVPKGVDGTP